MHDIEHIVLKLAKSTSEVKVEDKENIKEDCTQKEDHVGKEERSILVDTLLCFVLPDSFDKEESVEHDFEREEAYADGFRFGGIDCCQH